ncbi:multidrug effflux MFS transporter [Dellaglioa carnosa]|uniref:multidrug effflux MFS transporter n=1 Tax=Dellaglioa carnosa TaxID=2995136 RepID=UPI0022A8869A|nr:multidrug effflux MFS transporter [Dellaglioa carnosa]MCZ2492648.1 multidrug effflux MFS transporter [Dellaglioa carnosa]
MVLTYFKNPKKHELFLTVLLGTLSAFGPLSMDMYLPALPVIQQHLHTNASLTQLTITTCLLGLALGQLIVGPYSDKIGRRKPLLWGLILFAVTSVIAATSQNITILIGIRLLQGLAGSAGLVISRAIARDLYTGKKLTKFFSLLMAVNGIFPIISPIIGSFILKFTSWRGIFVILTIIGLLLFFVVLITLPETNEVTLSKSKSEADLDSTGNILKNLISDKFFLSYALIQGFISGAMFCYISGSSFVLQNLFGLSSNMFSLVYAINGFGIVLMSQLSSRISDSFSENTGLKLGVYLALLGSLLLTISLFISNSLPLVLISLFLIVSMVGLVNTTAFSLAMQKQGQHAGSASAVLGVGMNLVGSILSPFVGIMGDHSYIPMTILILICEFCALIIYLNISRKKIEI